MTKVPLFDEQALNALNRSIKSNLDYYRNKDKKWAESFLREKGFVPDGMITFPTVHLEYSEEFADDYRNAVKLHKELKFDNHAQASSGLIWTFISLDNLDYLVQRWPLPSDDDKAVDRIYERYCFKWISSKRKLARGWAAALWRIADLTYDKDRKNPYELTEEAFRNSDMIQHITDRAPFMNRDVTTSLLEYSLRRRKDGNPLKKEEYQDVGVFLNAVAGSVRIDILSKEEIRKIIEDYFDWRNINSQQTHPESDGEFLQSS